MAYTHSLNKKQGFVLATFLVIVGVVISAILVGFFASQKGSIFNFKKNSIQTETTGVNTQNNIEPAATVPQTGTTESSVSTTTPQVPICGISVITPAPNQTIGFGSIISGYVNGCGWTAFEAQAGTVQVLNANGQAVSNPIPLSVSSNWMQLPAYFSTSIYLTTTPGTSTGSLLFRNEDPSGERPQTFQVQIRF